MGRIMNKLILVLIITLTGCATYEPISTVERLSNEARARDSNPNKYAYSLGQEHGCSSGSNATGNYTKTFYKDVDQYVQSPYYKSGWDDGFAQCKGQGELINGVITNSLW